MSSERGTSLFCVCVLHAFSSLLSTAHIQGIYLCIFMCERESDIKPGHLFTGRVLLLGLAGIQLFVETAVNQVSTSMVIARVVVRVTGSK